MFRGMKISRRDFLKVTGSVIATAALPCTLVSALTKRGKGIVPLHRGRLLIVDDQAGVRQVFHTILSSDLPNIRIDLAENGVEALDAFSANHHAVILMGNIMPVMTGEQAFIELRRKCAALRRRMPSVVFCCGTPPGRAVRDMVMKNPAHALLRKPVRREILVQAVQSRLA